MKRFILLLFLAMGLLFDMTSYGSAAPRESTMEKIVQRGTMRVGFSSFVPWAMQDKNGKYIGFEIDVAEKLPGVVVACGVFIREGRVPSTLIEDIGAERQMASVVIGHSHVRSREDCHQSKE